MTTYVRNVFVNKVWFVALFAGIMLFSVTRTIFNGIEQIARDSAESQQRVNELMNGPH